MAKESKAAASGDAEVRAAGPIKDVDTWALEKGYADVTAPHPHYGERGWIVRVVDVGPAQRAFYAFAKAYFKWPIGKLLTEAEFDAAMVEVKGRKFGEHPVKS